VRIFMRRHESLEIELEDGTVTEVDFLKLKKLQNDPKDTVPDDGFFLCLRTRDNLKLEGASQKIPAIKDVRMRTGMSLRAAKEHVEAWMTLNGIDDTVF